MIVSGQFPPSLDSLTKATTGFNVQLSASSITIVGSGAGAGPAGMVVVVGLLAVGSVVSSTVIVCVTFIELPQLSVTEYVRVIISGQVFPSLTSPTC